jgi:hypothetical protein
MSYKYYSGNQYNMKRVGYVARMGERRGAYRFFVGKPDETRPFGRPT